MSSVFVLQSVSDGVVLLKGKAGQRSVEFSTTVDSTHNISPVDAALPIHRLAAKAQIKQLEDAEKGVLSVYLLLFFKTFSVCGHSVFVTHYLSLTLF